MNDLPATMILVEIVYALPDRQTLLSLRVPSPATVESAITASDLASHHPGLDWRRHRVGIFGRPVPLDHLLDDGDRIEIYRPLVADPRTSRRVRVEKRRAESGSSERKMRA